ncbi:MAG: hypothetical protein QNJ73_07370 [Gammaproteobacteria bacterium]|nr:hypothetical protein [Gammaproteobacteria bacterium]
MLEILFATLPAWFYTMSVDDFLNPGRDFDSGEYRYVCYYIDANNNGRYEGWAGLKFYLDDTIADIGRFPPQPEPWLPSDDSACTATRGCHSPLFE